MAKISKKSVPEANHVIMLIHGPEERLEVYMNHTRAPDSLVKLTGAFQKYFPQWKAKQGPGVLRYKCPHFGLDDEVSIFQNHFFKTYKNSEAIFALISPSKFQ